MDDVPIDGNCSTKNHVMIEGEVTWRIPDVRIDCGTNSPGYCI
jgi:hypothetical protein